VLKFETDFVWMSVISAVFDIVSPFRINCSLNGYNQDKARFAFKCGKFWENEKAAQVGCAA
jgi:hypothetical protein